MANRLQGKPRGARLLVRHAISAAVVWTLLVAGIAGLLLYDLSRENIDRAEEQARIVLATDEIYRSWAASHGGLYVKEDPRTPPNPFLDPQEREVSLADGRRLVLVNPAYMTRQIAELRRHAGAVQTRMVSLRPVNPLDTPDPWERRALESFLDGPGGRAVETTTDERGGRKILRMLRPLYTEAGCLGCHSAQGYKLGDLRGGLVVDLPVPPLLAATSEKLSFELALLVLLWLVGLGIAGLFTVQIRNRSREQDHINLRIAESEERLSLALEGGGIGLWDFDLATGKRTVNDQWALMLGRDPEEVGEALDQWKQFVHPEDRDGVLQALEAYLTGVTQSYRVTYRLQHQQGHWVWILDSGKIVERDEKGAPVRVTGTHVDVTQIKLMEERLRVQGRQRHAIGRLAALALEGAADLVVFETACREVRETLSVPLCGVWILEDGDSRLRLIAGEGWKDQVVGSSAIPYDPGLPAGFALEHEQTLVVENLETDDRIDRCPLLVDHRVVSGLTTPCLHGGQRLGAIGAFSTRQRTFCREEKLFLEGVARMVTLAVTRSRIQRENEKLARTLAQTHEVIAITDRAGLLVYVNPAFEKLTGYSSQEVLGRNPRILKSGRHGPELYRDMWGTLRKGGTWGGTLVNRRKDGTLYHEKATITPLFGDSHELTGFVKVARDVSRELEMENQLRQAQKLESIGQLAAGIAHEINTPTQYVSDNTRFLDDAFGDLTLLLQTLERECGEQAGGSPAEHIERIREALDKADAEYLLDEVPKAISQSLDGLARVTKIVRAMKEFSHPGSKNKQPVDLNKAIESTVTVARNEWKYVARMKLDLDPDLPIVACHAGELNQVVLNMVINAAHAIKEKLTDTTEPKGLITVRTRQESGEALIEIGDTGCGIPEGNREQIFEQFFTTKEVGKGTGQGLAIAHNVIVNQHGGRIDVQSKVGEGTTFVIRLPIEASVTSPVGA